MVSFRSLFVILEFTAISYAQYPPKPTGLTSLKSKLQPGVSISYKQSHICETTPGVKSYSGYVHLPTSVLTDVGDYNISTFFWYFESRHDPANAPLSVYLAGGPGESSAHAAVSSESGPCYANPDGNSTTINSWSFNNYVNVLYIDQPVQAGFSYDILVNGTFDLSSNIVTPLEASQPVPKTNGTFMLGTFASQNPNTTVNNTITAAKAFWQFSNVWLAEFPEYNTTNNQVSMWANSYAGYWGPSFMAMLQKELQSASSRGHTYNVTLDTLGITNGCIDQLYQSYYYPQFAYNSTYGFQAVPEVLYQESVHNFTKPDGCRDLILQCRELAAHSDPESVGDNATVNEACVLATDYCAFYVSGAYDAVANRSDFDIAVKLPDPCPYYLPVQTFLNQEWVLQDLGVPVNFTYDSNVVLEAFGLAFTGRGTGDSFLRGICDLEYVLGAGIKVAMVYGDRDYRCNWLGAENISLEAEYPDSSAFAEAGYEKIVTNTSYDGGVVRQFNKFSFSRVFQSGHAVSAYQPETVYRIFMRSMFNRDVATGKTSTSGSLFSSSGPPSSFQIKGILPDLPEECPVDGKYLPNGT